VKDAILEARRTQASRLVTPEVPRAVGTLLARQAALRQEARPVLSAESPELRRALAGVATVGAVVMVGAVVGVGAGEVGDGASASDGRTGDLAGGSAGILGGTAHTGMRRWHTPLTRITTIAGTTIHRRTVRIRGRIRRITPTRREAT
jgi:hypothetical protein